MSRNQPGVIVNARFLNDRFNEKATQKEKRPDQTKVAQ